MDLISLDATIPQEVVPLAVMLNFVGFANTQANRIREDGFDAIEEKGIETLEDQDIKDLATTFSCLPASSRISFGIARIKRHSWDDKWKNHVRVTHSVEEATEIDIVNRNTLCQD